MATIPLPRPISIAQFNAPTGEPTYTQIFNDTMKDLGTPADGMDQNLAALAGVADALAAEMAAENTLDNVGQAVNLFGSIDPGGLDVSISGFESTRPIGDALIADAAGTAPPELLTLPISTSFGTELAAPPTQVSVDVGTLKVGSAPIKYHLGQWITSKTLGIIGMSDVLLPVGDRDIFAVSETTLRDRLGNDISGQWYFTVTPAKVGNFLAQIEIFGGVARGLQINTYTVNVVP